MLANLIFWLFFGMVMVFGFVVVRGAPYVPSQRRHIRKAFTELYQLSSRDVLVDVGSGDGVVLRVASRFGARGVGYELNPVLVWVSFFLSIGYKNIVTVLADFWRVPLPDDTTVVYVFMVSRMERRMERKIQQEANRLGRSLAVIAYGIPFKKRQPHKTLDAYFLYHFSPADALQAKVSHV